MNSLFRGVRNMDQGGIESVLGELVEYTVNHFSYEEDLFAQTKYPQDSHHRELHGKLVAQVSAFF